MQAPPGLDCCYRHVRITLSQLAAMVSGDDEGGRGGGASFAFCLFCWFPRSTIPRSIGALLRDTSSVSFVLGLEY